MNWRCWLHGGYALACWRAFILPTPRRGCSPVRIAIPLGFALWESVSLCPVHLHCVAVSTVPHARHGIKQMGSNNQRNEKNTKMPVGFFHVNILPDRVRYSLIGHAYERSTLYMPLSYTMGKPRVNVVWSCRHVYCHLTERSYVFFVVVSPCFCNFSPISGRKWNVERSFLFRRKRLPFPLWNG